MLRMIVPILAAAFVATTFTTPAAAQQQPPPQQQQRSGERAKKPIAGVVNINTASAADLQRLPGIGAKTAARIIEYRQKNGPFKKIEELMNVRGVGEKNFLKLKPNITVAAAKADHDGPQ